MLGERYAEHSVDKGSLSVGRYQLHLELLVGVEQGVVKNITAGCEGLGKYTNLRVTKKTARKVQHYLASTETTATVALAKQP